MSHFGGLSGPDLLVRSAAAAAVDLDSWRMPRDSPLRDSRRDSVPIKQGLVQDQPMAGATHPSMLSMSQDGRPTPGTPEPIACTSDFQGSKSSLSVPSPDGSHTDSHSSSAPEQSAGIFPADLGRTTAVSSAVADTWLSAPASTGLAHEGQHCGGLGFGLLQDAIPPSESPSHDIPARAIGNAINGACSSSLLASDAGPSALDEFTEEARSNSSSLSEAQLGQSCTAADVLEDPGERPHWTAACSEQLQSQHASQQCLTVCISNPSS